MKILAQGAEAILIRKSNIVIKQRKPKSYRIPQIDESLRLRRTRNESRLLEKASHVIPAPLLKDLDEQKKEITIDFISGKKLSLWLDKLKNKKQIVKQIGTSLAKLHDANIIHGDLTTSNLIYSKNKVFFIDFGLGFHSSSIEDKAVDIYVFKKALEARHPYSAKLFNSSFIKGYLHSNKAPLVIKQLEKVERRGRYKNQY